MGRPDSRAFIFPEGYYPDQPLLNGGIPGSVYAGLQAVFEANGYPRTFGGTQNIGETYLSGNLGYTANVTSGSSIVTAGSGAFTADLVAFQIVLIDRLVYVVEEIISNTQIRVSPTPSASASNVSIRRVPALQPFDNQRVGLFAGSVKKYRDEAIFTAGIGEAKFNGSSLNSALNSLMVPQVAYPKPDGTYDCRPVGFTKPGTPTVVAVSGGTKNMQVMTYSFKATRKRLGFPGYGLASEAVEQTLPSANQRFQVTFEAFNTSEGQTSWLLWVTKARTGEAQRGPWFLLGEYTAGVVTVEWRDDELTERLVDNNYPPPKALFVASMDDALIFGSCYGKPDASGNPTAPGPGFAVAKPNNPEAFAPAASAFTSPAEDVRGMFAGGARLFAFTNNHLHIGTLTGSSSSPLVMRPYGQTGFWHQYNACLAADELFSFTGDLLVRMGGDDAADSSFVSPVKSELQSYVPQRTFVGHDPRNGWVVVFNSNYKQVGGFWITRVISLNYKTMKWNCPIELSAASADFTVTSCATVGSDLYFSDQNGIAYKWDAGGATINGFITPIFQDFGSMGTLKTLRFLRLTGRFNGSVGIYRDYDKDALIAGSGSVPSRTYSNPGYTPKHHPLWKLNIKAKSIAPRISFSMSAKTQILDSLEMDVDVKPANF